MSRVGYSGDGARRAGRSEGSNQNRSDRNEVKASGENVVEQSGVRILERRVEQ